MNLGNVLRAFSTRRRFGNWVAHSCGSDEIFKHLMKLIRIFVTGCVFYWAAFVLCYPVARGDEGNSQAATDLLAQFAELRQGAFGRLTSFDAEGTLSIEQSNDYVARMYVPELRASKKLAKYQSGICGVFVSRPEAFLWFHSHDGAEFAL